MSRKCGKKAKKSSSVRIQLDCAYGIDTDARFDIAAAKVKERDSVALTAAAVTLVDSSAPRAKL